MKAEIGNPCHFCGCSMRIQTKPQWIIDYEHREVIGLAHTTCTSKAGLESYQVKAAQWGETSPSVTEIEVASRIIKALNSDHTTDLYLRILLHECLWKTNNPTDCLKLPRIKELLDWWENGPKQMSPSAITTLKQNLTQILGMEV